MIDVEIKARCSHHDYIREFLKKNNARFVGVEEQIDVYFKCNNGRLKLRKGKLSNPLVFYERENVKDIKPSNFILYKSHDFDSLEQILRDSIGVLVEVVKTRESYFINNVKFNLDIVDGLGTFVEIEAMTENSEEINSLRKVVEEYMLELKINKVDLESHSYSDLLLNKN